MPVTEAMPPESFTQPFGSCTSEGAEQTVNGQGYVGHLHAAGHAVPMRQPAVQQGMQDAAGEDAQHAGTQSNEPPAGLAEKLQGMKQATVAGADAAPEGMLASKASNVKQGSVPAMSVAAAGTAAGADCGTRDTAAWQAERNAMAARLMTLEAQCAAMAVQACEAQALRQQEGSKVNTLTEMCSKVRQPFLVTPSGQLAFMMVVIGAFIPA